VERLIPNPKGSKSKFLQGFAPGVKTNLPELNETGLRNAFLNAKFLSPEMANEKTSQYVISSLNFSFHKLFLLIAAMAGKVTVTTPLDTSRFTLQTAALLQFLPESHLKPVLRMNATQ
jgi:hypothetical protein